MNNYIRQLLLASSLLYPNYGFASVVLEQVHLSSSYRAINDLNEIQVMKGDLVAFDIDGVLLLEGAVKADAPLLSSRTHRFITSLGPDVYKVALTARPPRLKIESFENLDKYGINFDRSDVRFEDSYTQYYRGILFAPNIHGVVKTSTKLDTLCRYMCRLRWLGHGINRVHFIDNEAFHFTQKRPDFSLPLELYHYQHIHEPTYSSTQKGPPSLSELTYIESKQGGTGGIAVVQDKNGKKWTVKGWKNPEHGLQECLGAALLKEMGINTPEFFLYNDLPENLKGKIQNHSGFYRIAEYIEGRNPTAGEINQQASGWFVPTSLISFWDVIPSNLIIDPQGRFWVIDTGGSFFFRAMGNSGKSYSTNKWMQHQISELAPHAGKLPYFKGIQLQNCLPQFKQLLAMRGLLVRKLDELCHALHYPKTRELKGFLESRLNHMQFLVDLQDGCINRMADPYALASELDSAGTLIYCDIGGAAHILIGKRARHNWWGNLGGHAEPGEHLFDAAARETREESGISFNSKQLLDSPAHDLIVMQGSLLSRYRTYLTRHSYVDPSQIKNEEYSAYKWVPVATILSAMERGRAVVEEGIQTLALPDGTILHPPFLYSLQQRRIRGWLRNINDNKANSISVEQSVFGHENLREIEREIDHSNSHALDVIVKSLEDMRMDEVVPVQRAINFRAPTASHTMLNLLYREQIGASNVEKIMRVVRQHYTHFTDKDAKTVSDIIAVEKQFADKFVLYHGLQSIVWFNFHALSYLRCMFDRKPLQTTVLRSLDSFFDKFPTPNDLLNYVIGGNNNYSEGYKEAGLSVNPSLFSNLSDSNDSTLLYFMKGKSARPPHDPWSPLSTLFTEMGLPGKDELIYTLRGIYDSNGIAQVGCLLQLFFDPRDADYICYPSATLGAPLKTRQGLVFRNARLALEAVKQGSHIDTVAGIFELQFRLHADIHNRSLVVRDYFSDGNQDRLGKLDMEIQQALQHHLFDALRGLIYNNKVYGKPPAVLVGLRQALNIRPHELASKNSLVEIAVKDESALVWRICDKPELLDDNDWLNKRYINRDTMQVNLIGTHPIVLSMQQERSSLTLIPKMLPHGTEIDRVRDFVKNKWDEECFELMKKHVLIKHCKSHINFMYVHNFFLKKKTKGQLQLAETAANIANEYNLLEFCQDNYPSGLLFSLYDILDSFRGKGDAYSFNEAKRFKINKKKHEIFCNKNPNREVYFENIAELVNKLRQLDGKQKSLDNFISSNGFSVSYISSIPHLNAYIINTLRDISEYFKAIRIAIEYKLISGESSEEMINKTVEIIEKCNDRFAYGFSFRKTMELARHADLNIAVDLEYLRYLEFLLRCKDKSLPIIELAKREFLRPGMSTKEILNILSDLNRIGTDADNIVARAKNLGLWNNTLDKNRGFCLDKVKLLGEEAEKIIVTARKHQLVGDSGYARNDGEIYEAIKQLGDQADHAIDFAKRELFRPDTTTAQKGYALKQLKQWGTAAVNIVTRAKELGCIKEDFKVGALWTLPDEIAKVEKEQSKTHAVEPVTKVRKANLGRDDT